MSTGQQKRESPPYWWPERKRLIFVKEEATPEFWDRQWQAEDLEKKMTGSRNSRYWSGILKKFIPGKKSIILEGGCGYGHIVDAMDHWGYQAIGVDYAPKIIAKIKEVMPNLDVRCGDVTKLEFGDDYFDGYWSLGVIEHFWDGYDDILSEMRRVLKVGGYAFVTFPCISRLDRIKIFFRGYKKFTSGEKPKDFYQFGLDVKAIRKDFEEAGFECVRARRRTGLWGLRRLIPAFHGLYYFIMALRAKNRVVKMAIEVTDLLLAPLCGHSVLLVLRKR